VHATPNTDRSRPVTAHPQVREGLEPGSAVYKSGAMRSSQPRMISATLNASVSAILFNHELIRTCFSSLIRLVDAGAAN
jgi:hypothetical protein